MPCRQVVQLSLTYNIRTSFVMYPDRSLYLTQIEEGNQFAITSQKFDHGGWEQFLHLTKASRFAPHGYTMITNRNGDQPDTITMLPDYTRSVQTINIILGDQGPCICLTSELVEMIVATETLIRALFLNPMPPDCDCIDEPEVFAYPCPSANYPIQFP